MSDSVPSRGSLPCFLRGPPRCATSVHRASLPQARRAIYGERVGKSLVVDCALAGSGRTVEQSRNVVIIIGAVAAARAAGRDGRPRRARGRCRPGRDRYASTGRVASTGGARSNGDERHRICGAPRAGCGSAPRCRRSPRRRRPRPRGRSARRPRFAVVARVQGSPAKRAASAIAAVRRRARPAKCCGSATSTRRSSRRVLQAQVHDGGHRAARDEACGVRHAGLVDGQHDARDGARAARRVAATGAVLRR